MPWVRPAVVAPFRIVVTSGDPVVRRGGPVTLTAYLEPTAHSVALPATALLTVRDGPGAPEQAIPMTGDGTAAFHATRPAVPADFEYRVEAGGAVGDWHAVLVADPVDLAEPTTAEIVPPPYAAGAVPARTAPLAGLDGVQFSTATLRFRFTRPAAAAALEWRPDRRPPVDADSIPIHLAPDRTAGTATFRLTESGTLRVVLVNETGPRKLRSETPIPVRVSPDAPPRFEQLSGVVARPCAVRPGERLTVAVIAVDDIGVAGAELEYATGADPTPTRIPIPLTGAGTRRAEGRLAFDLIGKGREGDTVRYRVRVTDTRRVADARLGPQDAVYPPAGWAELTVSESAPPLDRQEVFGQRDALRVALTAALAEVRQARAEVEALHADTRERSPLPVDQAFRLTAIRERGRKGGGLLHAAARDAALTPDLRPLAATVRDVADQPLRAADDALRTAATDNPADRLAALESALARFALAADRIEGLVPRNERLAQDRLDRRRLDALAADQAAFADRAKAGAPPEELLKAQRDLLDRLYALVADSDPLRRGVEAATGAEARRLAADVKALAALLRDLDAAARQLNADARRLFLDGLVRAQAALADRAAALFTRLDTAARLARVTPPGPDAFRRVADLLARDKVVDALIELEKLAQALDQTAAEFGKWATERADAKAAARQFALWQDDLRTRFAAATKVTPFDKLPDPAKAAFRSEQLALQQTAERLRLPPDPEVTALRDAALVHLRLAAKRLDTDTPDADAAMKLATDVLTRLADKTPTAAVRLARARPEFDAVRTEQDAIVTAADLVLRQYEKQTPDAALQQTLAVKLAAVQARQQKLVGRLAALDLPGLGPRQARAVFASKAAAADLGAGLPYDSAAALAWAKRELDRLRQAADGLSPADDTADDLARRQRATADAVAALGDQSDPQQLELLATAQKDVWKQLAALIVPETPCLFHDAREAVRAAEAGFRDGSKPGELRERTRAAADVLTRLADRLNGREADRDRVKRLAENRRQAVCDARRLAGKPYNPDASGGERRRLGWEIEELTHTRVGAAGQPVKKKVLDFYTRLVAKTEPDREAAGQRQLAEALAELAAATDGIMELVAGPGPDPVDEADPAGAYLPSKPFAGALRELAKQQRATRERASRLSTDAATLVRPAVTNPLAALERRQRDFVGAVDDFCAALTREKEPAAAGQVAAAAAPVRLAADRLQVGNARGAKEAGEVAARHFRALAATAGARPWGKVAAELADRQEVLLKDLAGVVDDPAVAAAQQQVYHDALAKQAAELARRLDRAAKSTPAARPALADAADLVRKAEALIADAARKGADGTPADAARLRAEAEVLLRKAADAAADGPPPLPDPDVPVLRGEAVKEADTALRRTIDALGPAGDPADAERTMRRATDALKRAANTPADGSSP
jgi:hypothetical protein